VLYAAIHAGCDHVCSSCGRVAITADVHTRHTVEELQIFTRTRSLSSPWANVVRTLIPLSCCDAAASHLIDAFGGGDAMKRTVGGTKWWQVRGVQGCVSHYHSHWQAHIHMYARRVEAEWVTAKKNHKDSLGRGTDAAETKQSNSRVASSDELRENEGRGVDGPEMDDTPCMLYIHGGKDLHQSSDRKDYLRIAYSRWLLLRKGRREKEPHGTLCTKNPRSAFQ
jgi:hypothetical protein